jgi:hypothetical protein
VDDFEYSNGACGSCAECGEATEQEWHEFCRSCYAEQNGWHRPARTAIEEQHEDREEAVRLRLLERVAELEQQVEVLRRVVIGGDSLAGLVMLVASTAKRVEALELGGSLLDRKAA